MTDPVICVCESCGDRGSLYLYRISGVMVAAVCTMCLRRPNVERITASQVSERRLEHSQFRARRRRSEQSSCSP
jgi:hypothetical protein